MKKLTFKLIILGITLVVLFFLSFKYYGDWLWFRNLGYGSVFETMLWARLGTFAVFFLLFALLAFINIAIARRIGRFTRSFYSAGDNNRPKIMHVSGDSKFAGYVWTLYLLIFSLIMGLGSMNLWEPFLKFIHAVPFGIKDPVFGKDAGFYVFRLPVYLYLKGWYLTSMFIIIAGVLFSYAADKAITFKNNKPSLHPRAAIHLAVLTGFYLIGVAWGYLLKQYHLLFSTKGVAFGASYTDVHALIPGYRIMMVLVLIVALLLMIMPWLKKWKPVIYAVIAYVAVWLVMILILPGAMKQYIVKPNELEKEKPYIINNINLTRKAYGLDKFQEKSFPADQSINMNDLKANRNTIENIRLWDRRPLIQTYKQLQEIRLYYDFKSVDVDRYPFGKYNQVALAARELPASQIPGRARTWVNIHLMFTHGYGAVMNPVNKVTPNGMPEFVIKNIPPQSEVPLQIKVPQIYYGEEMNEYVIARTSMKEFDYPKGDKNVYTTYKGTGGVQLKNVLRRIIFAWNFSDIKILISSYIKSDSRIMFHRVITERDKKIAPFLMYDGDPYLVLGKDGKIYWIHDAYTTTNMFPYSEPVRQNLSERGVNYIRNSVKVVIDAYNGSVTYYVIDPSDPLVQTYSRIYPALFKPIAEMPDFLKAHIRYPTDLFMIQNAIYNIYHMTNPQVFYNQEDLWNVPTEIYQESEQQMTPYYIIMKLPEGKSEEFILMLPLTPSRKDNMVAWMCARCDGDHYGEVIVYSLPKEKLIYGPMQIEARINQKPDISSELTLWGQKGSRVIRGNLLIIPIHHSFLYVEPVYLQSEQSQMPELKRVIVSFKDRTEMKESLDAALRAVFAPAEASAGSIYTNVPEQTQNVPGMPEKPSDKASEALQHYNRAMEYLRKGDWAGYGEELDRMKQVLEEMAGGRKSKK